MMMAMFRPTVAQVERPSELHHYRATTDSLQTEGLSDILDHQLLWSVWSSASDEGHQILLAETFSAIKRCTFIVH